MGSLIDMFFLVTTETSFELGTELLLAGWKHANHWATNMLGICTQDSTCLNASLRVNERCLNVV